MSFVAVALIVTSAFMHALRNFVSKRRNEWIGEPIQYTVEEPTCSNSLDTQVKS